MSLIKALSAWSSALLLPSSPMRLMSPSMMRETPLFSEKIAKPHIRATIFIASRLVQLLCLFLHLLVGPSHLHPSPCNLVLPAISYTDITIRTALLRLFTPSLKTRHTRLKILQVDFLWWVPTKLEAVLLTMLSACISSKSVALTFRSSPRFHSQHMSPVASSNAPPIYPYLASPMLTKLGAVFNAASSSSTPTILIRSIDPNSNSVSDLTFQEPKRFLATINNVAIDAPKAFGDFYFVVRNDSASPIANTYLVEEAYQFVGNQIIYLRNIILTSNDTTNFFKIYIDATKTTQLVVLNTFNVSAGLAIQQYLYGSIATVNKVIPPATPSFIYFSASSVTKFTPTQNLPTDPLIWAFVTNTSNTTTINVIQANSSFTNNIQSTNITLDGLLSIIIMNTNCFIVKNANYSNIKIVSFTAGNSSSSSSSRSYRVDSISSLLAS